MTTALAKTLTDVERERLAEHEATIERGMVVFVEVGLALLAIRTARLYRETHRTFDAYCRDRWAMTKALANRTIQAAESAEVLAPMGAIPSSERVARELAPLRNDHDAMRETWAEVVEQHGPEPTAAQTRAVVNGRVPGERPPPPELQGVVMTVCPRCLGMGRVPAEEVFQ